MSEVLPYQRKEIIGDFSIKGKQPKLAVVYLVRGKGTGDVVYVGTTTQDLKRRIKAHLIDAVGGSVLPFHKWIIANNLSFDVEIVDAVLADERHEVEKKWVSRFSCLLNVTDGGPGMSGHKFKGTDHAAKISEAIKTGKTFTCLRCGAPFWRKLSAIKKAHNKFCSRNCSNARHLGARL